MTTTLGALNRILSCIEDTLSAISRERENALDANDSKTYEQLNLVYRQVEQAWERVREVAKGK